MTADNLTPPTDDEIAELICRSFEKSKSTWAFDNYTYSSSVMFWMAALRLTKRKPFEGQIKEKILDFLEKKLDEATEQLLSDALTQMMTIAQSIKTEKEN